MYLVRLWFINKINYLIIEKDVWSDLLFLYPPNYQKLNCAHINMCSKKLIYQ